jgi:hypothetical protein
MATDRYGNAMTTDATAAAHYVVGVDALFAADIGAAEAFAASIAHDPDFALAHAGLARTHQIFGNRAAAKTAIARARELAPRLAGREASHVAALGLVLDGQGPAALAAIHAHLKDWPRAWACSASTASAVRTTGRPNFARCSTASPMPTAKIGGSSRCKPLRIARRVRSTPHVPRSCARLR